jgi:Tfp pilus assembly protein PilW
MKLLRNNARLGLTLIELMISTACSSLLLTAVISAGVALQRSFAAVEGYSLAEGDQLRVQDYIAMDCRRAVSATRDNGSWTYASNTWSWVSNPSGAATLILTVPNYYDVNGNSVDPSYNANGQIQYGGATTTISYYKSGSNFMRQIGLDPTKATPIATNVASFTVNEQDLTSRVTCSITFSPRFVYLPGPGPINGTTVYSNTFLRNAVARQ